MTPAEKREKVLKYYDGVYPTKLDPNLPEEGLFGINDLYNKMNLLARELEDALDLRQARLVLFKGRTS